MKIAVVDPSCFTLPYDHCLCEALSRRGCDVTLIASDFVRTKWNPRSVSYHRWEHFYRMTNHLYSRHPSGFGHSLVKGLDHALGQLRLLQRVRGVHFDVIHFQWLPVPMIDRLAVSRLRKHAGLVLTVHNSSPAHGIQSSVGDVVQLAGFGGALLSFDRLVAHTEFTRNELVLKFKVPRSRIRIIPHGLIDYYQGFSASRGQFADLDGKLVLLFFGSIKPYKGLDVLVRAMGQVPPRLLEKLHLLIVGDPRIPVTPLQTLTRELGIDAHITWDLRFIPEDEIGPVFDQADVVALPYRNVDQSGVLMTALAFGKPIIASKTGGFAEFLEDGVHGYLVEPNDPVSLASALGDLAREPWRVQQMSKSIQKLATGFSWDRIADQTVSLYEQVLQSRLLGSHGS